MFRVEAQSCQGPFDLTTSFFITDMPTNISNQIVKQNLHFDVDLLNEKSVQSF